MNSKYEQQSLLANTETLKPLYRLNEKVTLVMPGFICQSYYTPTSSALIFMSRFDFSFPTKTKFYSHQEKLMDTFSEVLINLAWSIPDSWYFTTFVFQGAGRLFQLWVVAEAATPQNVNQREISPGHSCKWRLLLLVSNLVQCSFNSTGRLNLELQTFFFNSASLFWGHTEPWGMPSVFKSETKLSQDFSLSVQYLEYISIH